MEADFRRCGLGRRRGWVEDFHDALEDIHDGGFVDVEADLELVFEQGEFSGEFTAVGKGGAHLDEGADDKNTHLCRPGAVEYVRSHDRAVFGESDWQLAPPAVGET